MHRRLAWLCAGLAAVLLGAGSAPAETSGEAFHRIVVVVDAQVAQTAGPMVHGESRLVLDASSHEPWARMMVQTAEISRSDELKLLRTVRTDSARTELYGAVTQRQGENRVRFFSVSWPGPALQ